MSQHTYAICKNKCLIPLDGEIAGINVPVNGWTAIDGGFTNTIAVTDIKEDNFPVYMDLDWDACEGDLATLVKNKGLLPRFTYTDGQIVLYATKKPAIDLVVRLTGVGVNKAPFGITRQPVDVVVAKAGDTATATVEVNETNVTYEWYYRNPNTGMMEFEKSSTTGNTYSNQITEGRNGFEVYCVITNAKGNSVTSNIVTFTVAK